MKESSDEMGAPTGWACEDMSTNTKKGQERRVAVATFVCKKGVIVVVIYNWNGSDSQTEPKRYPTRGTSQIDPKSSQYTVLPNP
jgi:hypothetical protein